MKQIKNHLKNNLNKWETKKWYHQRFDGAPYVMCYVEEAEINNSIKKKEGANFTVHYCFFSKGKADWYILMDDIKKVTDVIINHNEKEVGKYYIKKWKKEDLDFIKFCKKLDKTNLSLLTDSELFSLHKKFSKIYLNKISKSSIIDGFALGSDNLIAEMIKKTYDKSKIKNKIRFTEIFSKVTAPLHKSFLNKAQDSLYNIITLIKDTSKWKKLTTDELFKKSKNSKIGKLITKHKKSFFWIKNNYVESFILDEKYFINEIKQLLNLNIDFKKELLISKSRKNNLIKEKTKLFKILNFDKRLLRLIKVSEDFTYWQDKRKEGLLLMTYYANYFFKEISYRKKIPIKYLHYMTHKEIDSLEKNTFNLEILKKRYNYSSYYFDKEGFDIINGDYSKKLHKKLDNNEFEKVNDFRGLSANTGKAIGYVKIIKSVKEINKVKEGDILVAVMTRTDYVPAMKKAAAIITDEGGITSHAAIISREINKPCIIATKIATKVLLDGMLVEVNANHGWIKIIKKQIKK